MEITEIREIILSKDQQTIKKWFRHHLVDIINAYRSSKLSQAEFSKAVGIDAKFFYGLISLARKQGLLPRSRLGLSRMNKGRKKKSKKSLISKAAFKEINISNLQAPRQSLIRIQTKSGIQIEVEDTIAAVEILKVLRC